MSQHLQRGEVLYNQNRYAEAEQELRRALSADPEDFYALALQALCLSEQAKHQEATRAAENALALAPDQPFSYWALAKVLARQDRDKEALKAIEQAIALDPYDADLFGLQAAIHCDMRRWPKALKAAEGGLTIDPEHVTCTNMRAMALTNLGRRKDAGEALDAALSKEPENAYTHANKGWALLHDNQPREAMPHFREALRLDPDMEWARQGIIEALKARHFIYRQMLKFFLWMSRLSPGAQWGVIIGIFVLAQVLRKLSRTNPELAGYVAPLLWIYGGFVLLTWTADPLFNLLLRLHPFGKLALSREERRVADMVGLFLLVAVAGIAWGLLRGGGPILLGGFLCAGMIIPVAGSLNRPPGPRRWFLISYTVVLGGLGLASVLLYGAPAFSLLIGAFVLGLVLFGWIANAVSIH